MAQYTIGIRHLELLCPIGIHAEERELKVKLVITVSITYDHVEHLPVSLHSTFDYTRLVDLVTAVAKQPHMLIEQVANGFLQKLQPIIDRPCHLHMRIEKKDPIPGATLESAYVDISEELKPGKMWR